MHPWMMERLAQDRRTELRVAAGGPGPLDPPDPGRIGDPGAVNRRLTRYVGELLIRTGWRLVGPEAPTSGVRARLAYPARPT